MNQLHTPLTLRMSQSSQINLSPSNTQQNMLAANETALAQLQDTFVNNYRVFDFEANDDHNFTMLLLTALIQRRIQRVRQLSSNDRANDGRTSERPLFPDTPLSELRRRLFPDTEYEPSTPPPLTQHIKVRALGKVKAATPLEDDCAICMESHKKIDSMTTNCGHEFGQICLQKWMNGSVLKSCPICRNYCSLVTAYRPRATPKQKIVK